MKFEQGQSLLSIFWDDGEIKAGSNGYADIVVVMENGEMAGVPWAYVTKDDGSVYKYNLKMCQGVRVK
jgi:hypothetical protein